ncbi:acetyl-CoA carboxylase biotin carboxyl carrier protein subunit [Mucilaginibacter conchicola]|uniref:Acetyl-CoA carboxylase biotin carboxyl carrier protein subunit n=1 Tax=Mucilaginibacter conchicola TaxID=2303333 RepID=A0A372NSH1_9SPHI|nr:acetyl-CoA carboxylase biotin carboxyl carrier protein subunit [Mucilaginibacter conchicola]RFZ92230.1 acetyl-CoA carboxylase biotin carboxyl carrier protein subunit [Mucilaginibacter conchicola]
MYKIKVNAHDFELQGKGKQLQLNGQDVAADVKQLSDNLYHIINNKASYNAEVVSFDAQTKTAQIKINNNLYTVKAKDEFDQLLDKMGLSNLMAAKVSDIKAPMPGLVLKVLVEEGAEVKKGDNLFILEAMKMENIIKAPADVTIQTIKMQPGDKVEKGQVLMIF